MAARWRERFSQCSDDELREAKEVLEYVISRRSASMASPNWHADGTFQPISISPAALSIQPDTPSVRANSVYSGETALPERSNLRTHSPASPADQSKHAKQPYFCTRCHEQGTEVRFKTKHDWKRHERDFHETGYEWACQVPECAVVFGRQKDFEKHYTRVHPGINHPINARVRLSGKIAYGCGFSGCYKLTHNWKDRCDHVARDMKEGALEWNYTPQIITLLRHEDVTDTWAKVSHHWCKRSGITLADLKWDSKTSRTARQALECHNFEPDLGQFLTLLLKLGHPQHTVATFATGLSAHIPPTPLLNVPENLLVNPIESQRSEALSLAPCPRSPLAQDEAVLDSFESPANSNVGTNYRNSVAMMDADVPVYSQFVDISNGHNQVIDPCEEEQMTVNEFILAGTDGYSTQRTPALPDNWDIPNSSLSHNGSTSSPKRNRMRRGKDIFSNKRSQHLHNLAEQTHISPGILSAQAPVPRQDVFFQDFESYSYNLDSHGV